MLTSQTSHRARTQRRRRIASRRSKTNSHKKSMKNVKTTTTSTRSSSGGRTSTAMTTTLLLVALVVTLAMFSSATSAFQLFASNPQQQGLLLRARLSVISRHAHDRDRRPAQPRQLCVHAGRSVSGGPRTAAAGRASRRRGGGALQVVLHVAFSLETHSLDHWKRLVLTLELYIT